MNGFKLVE